MHRNGLRLAHVSERADPAPVYRARTVWRADAAGCHAEYCRGALRWGGKLQGGQICDEALNRRATGCGFCTTLLSPVAVLVSAVNS